MRVLGLYGLRFYGLGVEFKTRVRVFSVWLYTRLKHQKVDAMNGIAYNTPRNR